MASGTSLTVTVHRAESSLIVTAVGEIDLSSAPRLEQALAQGVADAAPPDIVVVDLSGVTFLDSTGLRVLVTAYEQCQEHGTPMGVLDPTAPVRRIMELTGLADRLVLNGPGHPEAPPGVLRTAR